MVGTLRWAQETKGLRYRRGMKLSELADDGETLVDVTPTSKGLWFEAPGKPYLVRPWTNAGELNQRLRTLAIIAQRQVRFGWRDQNMHAQRCTPFIGGVAAAAACGCARLS